VSVNSLVDYPLIVADSEDKFHGNRLLYVCWDNHLMFCAPVCLPLPPILPFGALVSEVLPTVYGSHPDYEQIDWERTQWFESGQPFKPDFGKSLADHGFVHKSVIRFRTPGLNGIAGS
jgi:phenol/toluene 2-monooxygenase (NADH) P4/A4